VRKQVPEGRPRRARRLVEIDEPFLGCDEHRDRRRRLRDRRPGEAMPHVAVPGIPHRGRRVRTSPLLDLAQRVHGGETNDVEKRWVSSGAAFEERVGYARAVRAGDRVWVSGTAPIMPGDADPPAGAYEQAKICLDIIERALAEAGAGLDDVVRTRVYVTDGALIDEVGRAHREAFSAARPATTGIVVELLDPRWLVEIEAEAVILHP
jgi:enamine deaminase RidA (YjgF/YER057c/UK114 family)